MQTSRFQLGLMAALAMSLGYSLSSSEAVGHPVASLSSSALWSRTGGISCETIDLFTVPRGRVAVITGLNASAHAAFDVYQDEKLVLEGGSNAAAPSAAFGQNQGSLAIPSGAKLRLRNDGGCSTKQYFIQGYYAQ